MELNLNTKFEIGNRVFVIVKENRCWQKKETCDVCMGQGYVPYREYRCTCPKCTTKLNMRMRLSKICLEM